MNCPVCSAPLDGSPKFCARCGSKLDGAIPKGTAVAPATEAEPRFDPFIGQTVGGKYKITRLLGEGGMGAVYVGEQNIGGTLRRVAIKTLHVHLSKDPKISQRFERECATVAELQHPNTIQLYDFGKTDDGILYMVMEFVQGESLSLVLEKARSLEPARTLHIVRQICDALGEAHNLGIVHRDLKPDNIVLTERAKDWVKVLDFGIAKRSEAAEKEEQKLTQQGTVLGTPPYMSPEQFTGKPIDPRSDIYSIAVITYEMLAGQLPFDAATPWEWATQHMTAAPRPLAVTGDGAPVPESMVRAVMQALAKDPGDRFGTTREFFDALAQSFGGPDALNASGGYGMAPASMVALSAVAAAAGAAAVGGAVAVAGQGSRGNTQMGGPPAGGAPSYGAGAYGPPVINASVSPGAMVPSAFADAAVGMAVHPNAPRRGRSGSGVVFAVLGAVLLVVVVGGVFAFLRGRKPSTNPHEPIPVASTTPSDATDPEAGLASNDRPRDRQPPLIDTSLPSLPIAYDPTKLGKHAEAGAGLQPSPPSNAPADPSGPAAGGPKACQLARIWQKRMNESPNPDPKLLRFFNVERSKCIAEGGHI